MSSRSVWHKRNGVWVKVFENMLELTVSQSTNNYTINPALFTSAGWDGVSALSAQVTILSGVIIGSSSSITPALEITGEYPAGSSITLINNGRIQGAGGAGGTDGTTAADYDGRPGGTAIFVSPFALINTLVVNNFGQIWGGGGGGGSGGRLYKPNAFTFPVTQIGLGGGGAGTVGGPAGSSSNTGRQYYQGQAGTDLIGGQGGVLSAGLVEAGDGGNPGLPGTAAATWINNFDGNTSPGSNGAGGAAGKAIDGLSALTGYQNQGDVRGSVG